MRDRVVGVLASACPVAHSDAWGGFWVVSSYDAVTAVYQDWETFSSAPAKRVIPRPRNRPPMPPIDFDPPVQRDYRHLLNPFLAPRPVAGFEPGVRALVNELIDAFIESGCCDLVSQFARPFPGKMLYQFRMGLDPDEVETVRQWTFLTSFEPGSPAAVEAQEKWNEWVYQIIERRRHGPRQDDMIDALLHGMVDGKQLDDEAIVGSIQILILGGFTTTTDSILNTMYRLACDAPLQDRLRSHPDLLPTAFDEFLRFDPPVAGLDRVCTRDTVLEGRPIRRASAYGCSLRLPIVILRSLSTPIDSISTDT
jgi:cytochrome P450